MTYTTSKKAFPIEMLNTPLTQKAIKDRYGATFVYEEGDRAFRVRAREFEYQQIMKDLHLAFDAFERSQKQKQAIS